MKGHALADFMAELSLRPAVAVMEGEDGNKEVKWKLYLDESTNENGLGARIMLISPEGYKITAAIRFKLKASNNEAE